MSGICGWFGGVERNDRAIDRIQRMAAALSCNPELHTARQAADGAALGASGRAGATDAASDGPIIAVSEGYPTWSDPALGELAKARGAAAALIAGFARHGRTLPKHVGGEFTFAVADTAARRGLVAIDRMGTRPMCYATEGTGGLMFGATTRSVRAGSAATPTLDAQSVFDFLWFGKVPAPATIWRDLRKLHAGEAIWWENGRTEVARFWSMPYAADRSSDIDRLSEETRATISAAVDRALVGEDLARTGAFLSGGLDSSTVVGYLARHAAGAHAFTIGFAREGYDEMEFARLAAQHFGARHHTHYLTPEETTAAIQRLAAAYDEPFGNSSAIAVYHCAKLAREAGISLMLAGDGGDELFAGNERYAKQKVFEAYGRVPRWARAIVEPAIAAMPSGLPIVGKAQSYVRQAKVTLPTRLSINHYYRGKAASEIFLPDIARAIDTGHPDAVQQAAYDGGGKSELTGMMHLDLQLTLADDDLRKVGRMCELAGIAVKYPLLDDAVVALSGRIPPDLLLKDFKLRYFYKYAFKDFLPTSTLAKSKQGFGLPYGEWMRGHPPLSKLMNDALEALKGRNVFSPAFIDSARQAYAGGHSAYYGGVVWELMTLELWLQADAAAARIS